MAAGPPQGPPGQLDPIICRVFFYSQEAMPYYGFCLPLFIFPIEPALLVSALGHMLV